MYVQCAYMYVLVYSFDIALFESALCLKKCLSITLKLCA